MFKIYEVWNKEAGDVYHEKYFKLNDPQRAWDFTLKERDT
jgi:hypothetical protein